MFDRSQRPSRGTFNTLPGAPRGLSADERLQRVARACAVGVVRHADPLGQRQRATVGILGVRPSALGRPCVAQQHERLDLGRMVRPQEGEGPLELAVGFTGAALPEAEVRQVDERHRDVAVLRAHRLGVSQRERQHLVRLVQPALPRAHAPEAAQVRSRSCCSRCRRGSRCPRAPGGRLPPPRRGRPSAGTPRPAGPGKPWCAGGWVPSPSGRWRPPARASAGLRRRGPAGTEPTRCSPAGRPSRSARDRKHAPGWRASVRRAPGLSSNRPPSSSVNPSFRSVVATNGCAGPNAFSWTASARRA